MGGDRNGAGGRGRGKQVGEKKGLSVARLVRGRLFAPSCGFLVIPRPPTVKPRQGGCTQAGLSTYGRGTATLGESHMWLCNSCDHPVDVT